MLHDMLNHFQTDGLLFGSLVLDLYQAKSLICCSHVQTRGETKMLHTMPVQSRQNEPFVMKSDREKACFHSDVCEYLDNTLSSNVTF